MLSDLNFSKTNSLKGYKSLVLFYYCLHLYISKKTSYL